MSNQADTTEHLDIIAPPSGSAPPAHVAFGDEDSSGGLVFGEVEDEVFSTPLAVTRASSRAAETPLSADDATFHSPHSASPTGHAPPGNAAELAAAALQQQFPEATLATDSTTTELAGAPSTAAAADQPVELLEHASGVDVSTQDSGDKADASDAPPVDIPEPHLEPAAPAAAAAVVADSPTNPAADSDSQTAAVADAAELTALAGSSGSGLLSLAELTLNSSSNSSSRDQAAGQMQPDSPSSPSAVSSTSSDTAAPAATDPALADSANASTSQPAAAAAAVATSSTLAASPAAAGSPRGRGSTVRLSPPCSPIKTHSSGGLDRAPSWQLQHAAAAAAGTAAHPAPPRSDMDLTRLSNTPASPHGEAGWAAWQQRRRHFFVLTAAGKPVYSRHGDEQALAGFMAVIQALLSVMSDQGDVIHSITVGSSSIEFLLRGQLYLVAVSSRGEAQLALRRQLELLYQSILMVATGGIERVLTRSPGYDVQQLLAGAKPSMNALISGYGDCPGWMMASVEPAPTAAADRQMVTAALQEAVKACDCLYGILLVAGRVVAVERGAAAPALNVFDLLLLINFSSSNESLRHNETFVPVCLPNFQPNAFVHAYVNCLDEAGQQQQDTAGSTPQQQQQQQPQHGDPSQQQQYGAGSRGKGAFLLLLSGSADAFHRLSAAQHSFVAAVTAGPGGGVLGRVQAAAVQPGQGRVRVEALPAPLGGSVGSTPLWHALIRYPQRHQHITLAYPQQLFAARSQVKQLVRSYCRVYCAAYGQLLEANAMATAAGPFGSGSTSTSSGGASSSQSHAAPAAAAAAGKAHKLVWVTNQQWVTGVMIDREVEVYATFDPLTEKDVGLKMAETLKRLFGDKTRRQDLLVSGL